LPEEKKRITVLLLALAVGFLTGALVTEILLFVLPTGVVKTFFSKQVSWGIDPIHVNLALFEFTFGLTFHFNFLALLAIAVTVYYFKWWF
jgi:hypothetical protein